MRSAFLAITLSLLTAACASSKTTAMPACSGPRRPANPNGSVLTSPTAPAPPTLALPAPCLGSAK